MTTKAEIDEIRAYITEHPEERDMIVLQLMQNADVGESIRQAATHIGMHRLLIAKGIVTAEEIEKAQADALPFVTKVNIAALTSDEDMKRETDALNHWLRTGEPK